MPIIVSTGTNTIGSTYKNSCFENTSLEINHHFASNFTVDNSTVTLPPTDVNGFQFSPVNDHDVVLVIKSIQSNAVEIDNISLKFVRLFVPYIVSRITSILNLIIISSIHPSAWKTSKVIQIGK